MARQKKNAASWYIAANHYLIVVVVSFIGGLFVDAILQQAKLSDNLAIELVQIILFLIFIYLGARYSSLYVNAKYIIVDSRTVINLSTLYFCIIKGIYLALILLLVAQKEIWTYTTLFALSQLVVLLMSAAVFFVTSKKYIGVT